MSDQSNRQGVLWAFSLTLLMVVGAAAANEDLRLVDAAKNQDLQQVRALLNGHPDVNVRSEDGSTALLWAAHWNDLRTAELLVRAGAAGLSVGTLQARLDIAPSTLSFHLKTLVIVGLVTQERDATTLICRANYKVMNGLVGFLVDECCADAKECSPIARSVRAR